MKALRVFILCVLVSACGRTSPPDLLGTLEWDRIAVPAELSETVQSWSAKEGDAVKANAVLLSLDTRRLTAKLQNMQAQLAQQQARLDELRHGTRIEQLDAAHAAQDSAMAVARESKQQYIRQSELASKQLIARSSLDAARASRDRSAADLAMAQARFRELQHGTRDEQIEQAQAAVAASTALIDELNISLHKLIVRAPRAGRVDALPFKPGDQAPVGATLVSLLVGETPFARVYIPADQRPGIRIGQKFSVRVQGVSTPFHAHLRSIASESAFTPYYALTGDDASRLVYRAELVIDDAEAKNLPAGLSVQVQRTP